MKKKVLVNLAGLKQIANSLTGSAKEFADAVISAFESAEADEAEHDVESLKNAISEIEARFVKQDEEVAERVAAVRESIMRQLQGGVVADDVRKKFTPEVCNSVAKAIAYANNKQDAVAAVNSVAVKNEISGLTFEQIVDYALQFKQEDSDEIFDSLYKTNRTKFFYGEIDAATAAEIAKQWNGVGEDGDATKAIQELEVEGKSLTTKYIYKRQRIANEDLDAAEEAGQLAALQDDVRSELRRGVKGLAVRAMLIGDTVNANGQKVTTFETIGTKTASDVFTTVLTGSSFGIVEARKTAEAVKTDNKVAVMTSATKLELATRVYATGGTPVMLSDDELAAQIGVSKIVTKDFIGSVADLKLIVFDPKEYWVKERKVQDVAWPSYENNSRNFIYEINMGGFIHGIQSTAIFKATA